MAHRNLTGEQQSMVEKIVNFIDSEAKIADEERDFVQYGDEALAHEEYTHWEPEEDSPAPSDGSPCRGIVTTSITGTSRKLRIG